MQIGGPAWPDGTSVAFVGPTTPDGVGKSDGVFLMRFDAVSGERTILAHASPSPGSPAWRPQRAPAAVTTPAPIPSRDPDETRSPETTTSNGDIVLAGDLAAIDAPTGALMGNLACQPCLGAHQLAWSRDGTTLAFMDAGSLKTWRDGDAAPRTLIACPGDRCPVELPSWAPGGGSILFGSGGRLFEIETTSLAIHAVPLPAGQAMARPAGWAVGDRIAFITTASDSSATSPDTLWIADNGGVDAHVVATDPNLMWASIAPSGDRIAVVASPGNPVGVEPFNAEVQVRVYETEGGAPRVLLTEPGCCRLGGLVDGVAWSPDTTTLALIVPYQNFEGGFARALTLIDVASGAADVLSPRVTGTRAIDDATFGDGGAPAWRPVSAVP